jgi:acetoin utilization deacetylase AcuC-like enzyme
MPAKKPDGHEPASRTGLVYEDIYLRHDTGWGHPEQPARLTAIMERLRNSGLLSQLQRIPPLSASEATPWIREIHTVEYIARVNHDCKHGAAYIDTLDAPVCAASFDVAVAAVGGTLAAADAVMQSRVRNAFCAVRPPGHHSLADTAMGFCLFNNVAITARYLQKKHGVPKVLIVDWDVHHGNGTQGAFYDDPTVLYFSVHRYPFYPGSGAACEKGREKGIHATVNSPLAIGSGNKDFQDAFQYKLLPAANAFQPDFVLISAGFDAHANDPLGGMAVTEEGYGRLTRMVRDLAEKFCAGRLVSVLEGGYDLDGLAGSVEKHIRVLME